MRRVTGSFFKGGKYRMKHFWKLTFKMFRNLLVAKVFGFVLSATIMVALDGMIGSLVTQICSFLILVVMMFSASWEQGSKDGNMVQLDKLNEDRWLGFKATLTASFFEIIAAVCLILSKLDFISESFTRFYGIFNSCFVAIHQALLPNTLTVSEHDWIGYIIAAATVLIAPLCAGFGYRLGLYQVNISDTLFYTTPESRKQHEDRLKDKHHKRALKRRFR